jgi:hypothetical protein
MVTIVSAFINRYEKDSEEFISYLKRGEDLLKLDQSKIIFIDEDIYDKIREFENEKTKIIKINKRDLYLNRYKNKISNKNLITDNPEKDTIDYIIIQCNKTEWIREAINLNRFNTDEFVWIDFGITQFKKLIDNFPKIERNIIKNVRIGQIWNLSREPNEIYKKVNWFFAGGVFGGGSESLLIFADLMRDKCKELCNKGILMWEVNIWYLIWKDHSDLFNPYYCDHNESIIFNY